MKKNILLTLLILICINTFAADVDEDELKSVSRGSVEFINYVGPHDYINTRQEIINIGIQMGLQVKRGARTGNYYNLYTATHLPKMGENGKMGADIIVITERGGVDHVRNLRFIIAGYIMTVYDYSFDQSFLLAEFVTIYNAVYRRNMDKFSSSYSAEVVKELSPQKAGLSTRYNEWKGNTQILVPLTEKAAEGAFGALDTDEISDENVIEDMRQQDDMGVDSRKDLVDIKDQELQQQEKDLLQDKDQVEAGREQADQELQDIQDRQDQLQKEEDDLAKQREEAEKMPDGAEKDRKLAEIDQRQQEIDKEQAELDKQQAQAEQKEAGVSEQEQDIQERESDLQQRQEDLQSEREQVAQDEKTLADQGKSAREPEYVLFMKVDESNPAKSGQLVLIDKDSGTIEKTSGLTDLRNRAFKLINETIVCISGRGDNANLVLFDIENLSIVRRSDAVVYENSALEYSGGYLYAVVKDGSSWYIGKFDKALNYAGRSDGAVDPYTPIIISGSQIYAQRTDGQIRILTKESFVSGN